jgi:hypothetical protein
MGTLAFMIWTRKVLRCQSKFEAAPGDGICATGGSIRIRHTATRVQGGYLWSPKRNANGARNLFYESMREVAPGDLIFSFHGHPNSCCGHRSILLLGEPEATGVRRRRPELGEHRLEGEGQLHEACQQITPQGPPSIYSGRFFLGGIHPFDQTEMVPPNWRAQPLVSERSAAGARSYTACAFRAATYSFGERAARGRHGWPVAEIPAPQVVQDRFLSLNVTESCSTSGLMDLWHGN